MKLSGRLNAYAAGTHISQNLIDAYFIDDAHTLAGQTQFYKTLL
jgi:hypothetical protein